MNDNLVQEPEKTSFYKAFFNEDIYVLAEEELSFFTANITAVSAPKQILFSGNKMAKTLLLFNYINTTIPENDKNFLNQVLKAVSLSLETVAWVNIGASANFSWELLKEQSQIENIIAFDCFENLPADIKPEEGKLHIYHGKKMHGKKMLLAAKLQDIALNINQKKTLWEGLKNIFNL